MVEFALALPILALMLFSIVQFGLVFNNWVEVSQAARVGARKASLARKSPTAVNDAVRSVRRSTAHLDQDRLDVRVEPGGQPWRRGAPVKVRVAYPFQVSILGRVVRSGSLTFEAIVRVQ